MLLDILQGPLGLVLLLGFWIVAQGVVLPRLGVSTSMVPTRRPEDGPLQSTEEELRIGMGGR